MPSAERTGIVLLAAAAIVVGLACDDNQTVASRFLKRVLVPARTGGTVEITAAESGELAGTRLIIPADALEGDTIITVELISRPVAANPAGPVVGFGPPGTVFRIPTQLALPADTSRTVRSLILEAEEEDGKRWTIPETGMVLDAPNVAITQITRLAAFQIGWRVSTPCIPVTFSEGLRAAGQLKGIHSHLPRRPSMNPRMTVASALAASCLLFGCQEPDDTLEQSELAAHASVDRDCMQRCQLDAREALERCLQAGNDARACSARHATTFEACAGTCNAPCPPTPPPPPPPPIPPPPPPPRVPPPPPRPPVVVPPPPPPPASAPDPCILACGARARTSIEQCRADGTAEAVCRDRASDGYSVCLNQCPMPPTPRPLLPDPCTGGCGERAQASIDQCVAAGNDVAVCRERVNESFRACLNQCPPSLPPPPPAPAPPADACAQACGERARESYDQCVAGGTDAAVCRERAGAGQRACLDRCPPVVVVPPPPPPATRN